MKHLSVFAVLLLLLLPGCDQQISLEDIEDQVRTEVVSEFTGIATLQAIYLITYTNSQENLIQSDDLYIQTDSVSIDYGFVIEDKSIQVIKGDPKNILKVRLNKGKQIAVNRATTETYKTHEDYLPLGDDGKPVDVDVIINQEIKAEVPKYEESNLKLAADNIRNFFKVLAAKYKLELDFKIDG
ncbi:MAG: hypothetical protein Q3990_04920 [Desulfovibrionaceae bacterium]|nr:hypothetical protein [Desulfovibrionaceae bacterium]